MNSSEKEDNLTLGILSAIEHKNDVTQRHLADNLGVALGLANSYLKRCVRKGLVKIHQAPANRYLYYLTPKGFAEKSRLTTQYLISSFDFYRQASRSCSEIFKYCKEEQQKNVIICGISELAEIATLRASDFGINLIGYYDKDAKINQYLNKPVWNSLENLPEFDNCVITDLSKSLNTYSDLNKHINKENILLPSILGIYPKD